jgi:hypothetical protein
VTAFLGVRLPGNRRPTVELDRRKAHHDLEEAICDLEEAICDLE